MAGYHTHSATDGLSINDYIDPQSVTLSYTTVDNAVGISQRLGRGSLLAKIDLKAFRQCLVRQEDWHLLGLHWRGKFYYDKCLPFGLCSSHFLFDTVASALGFIFKHHLCNPHIIHYLDDFLIAAPPHTSTFIHTDRSTLQGNRCGYPGGETNTTYYTHHIPGGGYRHHKADDQPPPR